jgi:hypothetical protein
MSCTNYRKEECGHCICSTCVHASSTPTHMNCVIEQYCDGEGYNTDQAKPRLECTHYEMYSL